MAEIDRQNEEQVAKAKKSHARQGGPLVDERDELNKRRTLNY